MKKLLSAPHFYSFTEKVLPPLALITLTCLITALYLGLWWAPEDYQQRDAFRILYVHVPCAIWSLGFYVGMSLAGIIYYIWRIKVFAWLSQAAILPGMLLTGLALVTGSIWGKPMWGTWWVWDARLTSELILFFLFFAQYLLAQTIQNEHKRYQACALLGIVGLLDIPIIHYSVEWWQTLHQGSTLLRAEGPLIHPSMRLPLWLSLIGVLGWGATLALLKVQTHILRKTAVTE